MIKIKQVFVAIITLLIVFSSFTQISKAHAYSKEEAEEAITETHQIIINCYKAALEAEKAGANITELTKILNEVGDSFSMALLALKNGDYDLALQLTNKCNTKLEGFIDKAEIMRNKASEEQYWNLVFIICTGVSAVLIICIGFVVWNLLKRRYSNGKMKVNPKDYQILFLTAIFVSALILASPALSHILVYPRTEFFTELWILDSNHKAENYPFNISQNQNYNIYLGIANHLGHCAYYMVQVKFRNETQPAPTSFGPIEERLPSSLSALYNFTFFIADEQVEEHPLTFSINYVSNEELTKVNIQSMKLNDATISLPNYVIGWNSTRKGFYGFLFFELWLYDENIESFKYNGRFVGLWLNMTLSA